MSNNAFLSEFAPGLNKDYSNNINYNTGETIRIPWELAIESSQLQLWQDNYPGDAQGGSDVVISNNVSGTVYTWMVSYSGLDPNYHNVYYFQMNADSSSFFSHYFNISGPEISNSASSTPTPPPVATPNGLNPSTTTSTAPQVTVIQVVKGGLGAGAVAAIIIGVILGVLGVAGLLWWGWRFQKQRNTVSAQQQPSQGGWVIAIPANTYEAPAIPVHQLHEM